MNRCVCVHAHFYQPPRENPWLEDVELQDSAYPYHDWNERITSESYAPNASSRILDARGRIIEIVNNYTKISFNFGPTLLSWMEKHAIEMYRTIIEIDKESRKRFSGHGSAIAQNYNHIIMPLANKRDKRTQVLWGIRDFEHRFGRKPEGMWLSETAIDLETLDILSEYGIKFTLLAPHQARCVRKIGSKNWKDVNGGKIDPQKPYICHLSSGRTLTLFFFDGRVSQEIAFGGLLNNGEVLAKRLVGTFPEDQERPRLEHIATDGETYGHHHRHGDMALAFALHFIESNSLAKISIYGEYLEKYPPDHEVEIFENTSWSCCHGIERWRSDCGCNSGMRPGWNQAWRGPLRAAMDGLRNSMATLYEKEMIHYFVNPWQVRDDYIEIVLDRDEQNVERFLAQRVVRELSRDDTIKILNLLEMQRHAMFMYTSCGWFFDEISGIETVQIIQYAARAMQLAKEVTGVSLEPAYIQLLEQAPSNIPDFKQGAQVYEVLVKPAIIDLLRVGAHYAASSLFEEYPETTKLYCYTADSEIYDPMEAGRQKLAVGRARVRSDITWNEEVISFAVLHLGDHNINGGVREFMGNDAFAIMHQEIKEAFLKSDVPEVIRLIDKHFQTHNYSLWHLFKDEQRKVLNQIIEFPLQEIENSFRQIHHHHYPIMQAMNEMRIPLPRSFATPMAFILNIDLCKLLENEELDIDQIQKLIVDIRKWSIEIDQKNLEFVATQRINKLMEKFSQIPNDIQLLENIESILNILDGLFLDLDLGEAQSLCFSIGKQQIYDRMREKSKNGDPTARRWIEHFNNLREYLHVRIT